MLEPPPQELRFEMSELAYISSMGLGSVIRAMKVTRAGGGQVAMVGMQPVVQKVFEIAAALPEETIFASVEEADRYFDAIQRGEG